MTRRWISIREQNVGDIVEITIAPGVRVAAVITRKDKYENDSNRFAGFAGRIWCYEGEIIE